MNFQSKDGEAGKRELHREKKEWDVMKIGKHNVSGRKETELWEKSTE